MNKLTHDVYFLSLCLVIITLPFAFLPNNIAIIFFIVSWVAMIYYTTDFSFFNNLKSKVPALLLIAFALLYGLNALIKPDETESLLTALKNIEVRTAYIFFPLAMTGLTLLSGGKIKRLFDLYVITIIIATGLCLVIATVKTVESGTVYFINPVNNMDENNFMYHRFSSWIGIHAVYLASYTSLAFFIVFIGFVNKYEQFSPKKKVIHLILLIYFAVLIFLLKSISVSVSFLSIFLLLVLYYLYYKVKLNKVKLSGFVLFILLIVAVFAYGVNEKINIKKSLFEYSMEDISPASNWNPVNLRLALWEISFQIIRDNWLTGVGFSHMDETLKDYYTRNNFEFGLSNHFNPHNQFLQTFIILGIAGFVLLVFIFLTSFKLALAKKDVLMIVFLSTFLLFSISESTFTVNKGVVFFSFFLSFFTFLPEKSTIYLIK